MTAITTRFFVLVLMITLVSSAAFLLSGCASEEEKPPEQVEQEASLEESEQPQPEADGRDKAERSEYVARIERTFGCQVSEATTGMSEQEADAYLAEIFAEAHALVGVSAQDVLAERGYDCGWKELQASLGDELDLMRLLQAAPGD